VQESSAASLTSSLAPPTFNDLLASTQRPLFAFVAGLVGDAEQARDIVQDVYCDAWRALQRGAPPFSGASLDSPAVRSWLFHAAYCDAASALHRGSLITWESLNARRLPESLAAERQGQFEDAIAERQAIEAALAMLPPEDAVCLLLNALQGFTALEIGEIIGVSTEASKKRLTRAKRRLREAYTALNARDEELRP
jgi:RNA polymerase sigma factor (sigma-70 family)